MDKEDVVHSGLLLTHKKEGNLAICTRMDGSRGCYVKGTKSGKDQHCIISLISETCRKAKQMSKEKVNRLIDSEKRPVATRGKRERGRCLSETGGSD